MACVYIALGSNLKKPRNQVELAINRLSVMAENTLLAISPFYRSIPLGFQEQPDFLNAVIKIETAFSPFELLETLQYLEVQHGRQRTIERFGPRTLDLDILLYDQCQIQSERLTIPHYDMKKREFVLYPLFDIEPRLILPDGVPLAELITRIPKKGMEYWTDEG